MTVQTIAPTNGVQTEPLRISAEDARRRANSYLVGYVSTGYRGIEPELVQLDPPVWQLVIQYKVPTLPSIRVGFLDVNAVTGEALPLTNDQIEKIRERARAFLTINAPPTAVPN